MSRKPHCRLFYILCGAFLLNNCHAEPDKQPPKKKETKILHATNHAALPKINFTSEVKPILEASCVRCHNAEKSKGDVELYSKELALSTRGNEYGKVIIAGNADASGMIQVLQLPEDDDYFMPAKGDPLTEQQKDILIRWINEGAHWDEETELKEAPSTEQ